MELRSKGIVIASLVLCFSCCCQILSAQHGTALSSADRSVQRAAGLALCGVVTFFCVNGIPQRFHKPLESAVEDRPISWNWCCLQLSPLEELQKKGYLPRLDEDLRGDVEEKLPDLEDLEEVEKKLENVTNVTNVLSPKVALN